MIVFTVEAAPLAPPSDSEGGSRSDDGAGLQPLILPPDDFAAFLMDAIFPTYQRMKERE